MSQDPALFPHASPPLDDRPRPRSFSTLARWAAALLVAAVVAVYIVLNFDAVARPLKAIVRALAGRP